tara:strand:- start:192 stop:782 length:591 start_codon:yes stop_codon:yes gene_type:complete
MLIGLGLTALCLRPVGAEALASAKRAVPALVLTALTLFGFGAHHTWVGTQRPSRMAPAKVARFVASYAADRGRVVCLGLRGLEVAWRLGPWPNTPRVSRTASELKSSVATVGSQLKSKPPWLVLVGDRWAIEEQADGGQAIGMTLDQLIRQGGYTLLADGHRYLDQTSVRVYEYGGGSSPDSRATVRPQIYPGQAP